MNFERMRQLRKELGMSQSDVGEFLGIVQTVYSRYERGQNTIPLELLLKLCDLYGVSADYILGRSNVRHPDGEDAEK